MEQTNAGYMTLVKKQENRKQILHSMISRCKVMISMAAGRQYKQRCFADDAEERRYTVDQPVIRHFRFNQAEL